jgi:hypothetical protein
MLLAKERRPALRTIAGWARPFCSRPAQSANARTTAGCRTAPIRIPTKKKDVVWFALNADRPLFAFAGIWTEFKGARAPNQNRSRVPISSTAF